ncbi:hypothetical protein YC2023_095290 [Brassica napus]
MRQNPESIATAPCHLPFDLIEICFSSSFKLVFKVVSSSTSPYPEVAYFGGLVKLCLHRSLTNSIYNS